MTSLAVKIILVASVTAISFVTAFPEPSEVHSQPSTASTGAAATQRLPGTTSRASLPQMTLDKLLIAVDQAAAPFDKAKNSIEKDDAVAQAQKSVAEQAKDCSLVVEWDVADVRMVSEDVAEIQVKGFRAVPYLSRKDARLSVALFQSVKVRMDREQAKQIRDGDILSMTAKPVFYAGRWGAVGASTDSQQIITISIKNAVGFLGTITAREYTCMLRGQTLQTAFGK